MTQQFPRFFRTLAVASFAVLTATLIAACTTATYGQSFLRDKQVSDQYRFKIYVGGFSGPDTADERARSEIKEFMAKERYVGYQILDRRYNLIPSYYEYTVRFTPGARN